MANRCIRQLRIERQWTQADLAKAAGISRASISAIESQRLIPSVQTALALATVFGCTVEEIFGTPTATARPLRWAWEPTVPGSRFWLASVRKSRLAYPVESTAAGLLEHDGMFQHGLFQSTSRFDPEATLIIACCDPAASLLAEEIARQAGVRVIVLPRSSRQSLTLLGKGLVHVAGLHLSSEQAPDWNENLVRSELGRGYRLLRLARWEDGLAIAPNAKCHTIRQLLRSGPRIVGREPGSGARQCLDEVLGRRPAPAFLASSHFGVIEAIRSGWADTGPCLRLTAEEAGLAFLSVRKEIFELCFAATDENDPRIRALIAAVRSASCRRLYGELPGYETSECGELREII
jgi:molybdate-binding protein/DNA-binding XRE family transcriptional regulator